jgi:cell division protein ZapE
VQPGPLSIYRTRTASGTHLPDDSQLPAVRLLDRLWHEQVHRNRPGFWQKVMGSTPPVSRGCYLWGGVGRGKTWMMDLFFDALPFAEKQRIHFHRFMARVHAELKQTDAERNPLKTIARDWARDCRVLCFDEFFVSDIADAMLLGGLLESLFENGVVLVATSNVHPDDLYRDGLQRARFLPAIELIKSHTQVLHVDGETDYRLRILERSEIYHHPLDDEAVISLNSSFEQMAGGCELATGLEINGRAFQARRRGDGIIWFDFKELCEKPRSSLDYIEISRSFNTVMLSGVPVLDQFNEDAARRFISLVDEFYDRNVKLLISAAAAIDGIYQGERLAFEFQRTQSRLTEMQTHAYLARPHLP